MIMMIMKEMTAIMMMMMTVTMRAIVDESYFDLAMFFFFNKIM